ncbi:MAG: DUF3108 domain-containing protein [Betaproteobacteria bacterium]
MHGQIISRLNVLLFATCAIFAGHAHCQSLQAGPTQILAHYKIHKSGILIGTVEERLSRDGDTYKIVSETHTAGALKWFLDDQVTLSSEGKVGPNGLEPFRYELKRRNDPTKNVSADFDQSRSKIISNHHNKTETFHLPAGTMDRLSALYQFAFVTTHAPEVTFWMSQGKEAEQYHYRKQGEPVIQVGDTSYPTLHYARVAEKGRPQAQLWLAKDRQFLPVRMIFEDSRGLSLEQTLVDLQIK